MPCRYRRRWSSLVTSDRPWLDCPDCGMSVPVSQTSRILTEADHRMLGVVDEYAHVCVEGALVYPFLITPFPDAREELTQLLSRALKEEAMSELERIKEASAELADMGQESPYGGDPDDLRAEIVGGAEQLQATIDSLRFELAGMDQQRQRDNAYLLGEIEALRKAIARGAEEGETAEIRAWCLLTLAWFDGEEVG